MEVYFLFIENLVWAFLVAGLFFSKGRLRDKDSCFSTLPSLNLGFWGTIICLHQATGLGNSRKDCEWEVYMGKNWKDYISLLLLDALG